jgi:hypothetical protein
MIIQIIHNSICAGIDIDEQGYELACAPILTKWRRLYMIIKITKIDRNYKLGKADAIRVHGERVDGTEWSRAFFANETDVAADLANFGVGEWVNVKLLRDPKNNKFWNIKGFTAATSGDREAEEKKLNERPTGATSPNYKTSGTSSGSNGKGSALTKEEWAEKDRKTAMSIAKAVGVKAAVVAGKTTPKAVIKFADELLDYLLDTSPFSTVGDDPLDPPK